MLKSQGLGLCHGGVPLFLANFPNGNGLLNDFRLPRRPLMVRAALLRRSRCCDGDAQTSSVALSARRVRDAAWVKKIKSCVWVATHRITGQGHTGVP